MRALPVRLSGPVLIEPVVHRDPRGFFQEVYRQDALAELGITDAFVQDNHSRSSAGIVRGMHFQDGMAKLVRCVRGAILDVLVDIRVDSPAFGQWEAVRLDDENCLQLYCPNGFAHGFCVCSEIADVVYKTSAYWDPARESGFAFDDPEVAIQWPAELELIASERDRHAPLLSEIVGRLPFRIA
ncbi:MAG: dTDP-4-dehydrorhamnose 3,5-epimerase [Solirubrobacteraceae bacterium]|jgi:dTDP-4-dehydrorhamnose 3,5-epimerase